MGNTKSLAVALTQSFFCVCVCVQLLILLILVTSIQLPYDYKNPCLLHLQRKALLSKRLKRTTRFCLT